MSKYCDSTYSFWSKQYCIETVDGQAVWFLYNQNPTLCAFFNSLRKVCVHREYLSVKIPCGNSKKFNNVWQWVFFPDDYEFYDQKSWNNGPPWIFRTVRKLNAVPSPNPQHRIWSSYLRTTPTRFRSEWRSPEKHWVSKLYGYKTFKDYKNILIDILL